ncbi:MAG: DUF2344 domain-containing protein, partial [Armatimonadetes bacterium]|nr:DUF2344 domain-containing protein [Armatimonadota bacterium]
MDGLPYNDTTLGETRISTLELTFRKDGPARWLGHLDVMRAFERALRRTGIPVALTQGNNPPPRLRFAFPASVGLTAHADVLFADIASAADAVDLASLNANMPGGLWVRGIVAIPPDERKSALLDYGVAEYRLRFRNRNDLCRQELEAVAAELMGSAALPLLRAPRPDADGRSGARRASNAPREVDARPYLAGIRSEPPDSGEVVFTAQIRFGADGALKPTELCELLAGRL